jgi:integrase
LVDRESVTGGLAKHQTAGQTRYRAPSGRHEQRVTLHECRHMFASLMIAAGVNARALSTYMGHANISITLDRYGHRMPGNEAEAAGLLDAHLQRADTAARLAQLNTTDAITGASE